MTATATKTATPTGFPSGTFNRILDEGYGPGAWYGADLRASLADVGAAAAFTRPASGRHNIAEVTLHNAYWTDQIASKLTGTPAAAFPLEGEDWFEAASAATLSWKKIAATLDAAQQRLSQAVSEVA